jgi:hypothetical protein
VRTLAESQIPDLLLDEANLFHMILLISTARWAHYSSTSARQWALEEGLDLIRRGGCHDNIVSDPGQSPCQRLSGGGSTASASRDACRRVGRTGVSDSMRERPQVKVISDGMMLTKEFGRDVSSGMFSCLLLRIAVQALSLSPCVAMKRYRIEECYCSNGLLPSIGLLYSSV